MGKQKRADRFVVGYPGRGNVIYGKPVGMCLSYVEPMLLREAQRSLREDTEDAGAVIYELVEKK